MANQPTPSSTYPPQIHKGLEAGLLIRETLTVNKPSRRPYFRGGVVRGGGWLISHILIA